MTVTAGIDGKYKKGFGFTSPGSGGWTYVDADDTKPSR